MSVDVEDWFHVENLKRVIDRDSWSRQSSRVERNVDRLLELMAAYGDVRSTWFILGWVAERWPKVVSRIAAAGHEIASHGYDHALLDDLSPDAFRADVNRSKHLLEDLSGAAVIGYRAPSFSIKDWALPILQEVGFEYDSSHFPTVGHDRYGRLEGVTGKPVAEVLPGFFEISISSMSLASVALPWGGGGYFRLLPYPIFRAGARRILRSGSPYVFYIHPWEIDPDQPRPKGLSPVYRFRHYVGLGRSEDRFTSLLADFSWTTMAELLRRARPAAAAHRSSGA